MPFCKTYQINNREEGKAAQRDQSYRSCIITLLIFFFMCLILIFACTPWKIQNERERNHYTEHELQHHYQERTNKTTITVLSTTEKIPTTILSRTLEPTKAIITSTDSGSTEDTHVITKDYSKKNVKGSRHFERYLKNTSGDEIPSTSISQENTKDYNTEKVFKNTDIKKKSSSFSTLSLDSVPNNNDTPSTSQNGTISTTTLKYVTTVDNYITLLTTLSLPNLKNNTINPDYSAKNNSENSQLKETSDNVISTSSIQLNLEENKDIKNSTTKYSKYEEFDAMEYKTILTNKNSIPYVSNYTNATIFYDNKTSPVVPIIHNVTNFMPIANIILSDENTNICETGHCKQIASRMLSYMNHSADPCDDFYEYACGGFEVNSQLVDEDLVRKSENYERIVSQMFKEKRENIHSTFETYYDSCMQYEKNVNLSKRVRMVNDMLRKIGKFYTLNTWPKNYGGFTKLFAELILHHSALLFDVVPEMDEYRPKSFTLKIGPSTYESPFKEEFEEDLCSNDKHETKRQYVDLKNLYNNYKRCKNDTSELMRSITKALTELDVFKNLNNNYLETNKQSEYIEKTVHVINSIIMQEYMLNFPSTSEIREAYLMNNYSKVSLKELQSNSAFIKWASLIYSLTEMNVMPDKSFIQVYFYDAFTKGLRKLEQYAKKDPMGLNNAIMGLYAHKLYHEFVLPKHDNLKDYCLRVATNLLQLEASSLYISSFSDHEITYMNNMIEKTFNKLKQTLSMKMQNAQWAIKEGREELLKKINGLKLALPVVSYFKNRDSLYNDYNISEIILCDNYFNNSMILLKRYRTLMYTELKRQVGDPKQVWTYYAMPFQSKARVIYPLNLIVIPYGIIDWSLLNKESLSFDYLLLATLGNLIAHQIAHHFDTNGIHYWNQTRNTRDSLMFENEFTDTHFDDYINCQKKNLYQEFMNMTLPFTNQIVFYKIPRLTLNERLSEIMGLRLAYDTLALMKSDAKGLPWIQLRIDQLFYLAYAQMYCTKIPLTSSYISLYESEDLPNRIRVFVSASNDELLAEAWNCPLGSQIAPIDICSAFPYIDTKET
ncbi:hypothetical protein PUN28_016520 [Cardiocondyla obscurior]|uniref:Endothelin-converting enzyme 2 n=1 Tax=Cardiocondyla obscurior TaxID=286306 RepID=A0AAW2ERC6_9HYME